MSRSLVLCRLGTLAVCAMIWFGLFPFLQRWFFFFLRFFSLTNYRPIDGLLRWAISWREDHGSREETEVEEGHREEEELDGEVCRNYRPIEGPSRLAIPWREDHGSREVTEVEESHREEEELDGEVYPVNPSDDLHCDYDSTWETDQSPERSVKRTRTTRTTRRTSLSGYRHFSTFQRAARDMQNYRNDYPGQLCIQSSNDKPNLDFYLGKRPCVPDDVYINDFHNKWKGDYDKLEFVHTFIQWLFPLREPGMNSWASTLTKEEIQEFLASSIAMENLLKSYKLMLDFYGIKLCDEKTGKVEKASNWEDRFNNLNSHTHNSLRITRILKCLGTLGYRHYQCPLVQFFLNETLVYGHLPNVKHSVLNYFLFAVLNKRQRRKLLKFAYLNYNPNDEFVWCPLSVQKVWSEQARQTGF
ncbi:opioid growth factor receptor-like protein 1 [Mastacembelus armatus]|uniref:opioid growth factor receptor-like protein 1 n=1 Tax=Mastacembelus armatus TaxID=205130 RepID=UPI000E46465A|nr:opioid growth factor receptor-like protein 1 [Mastacembelus armatus]